MKTRYWLVPLWIAWGTLTYGAMFSWAQNLSNGRYSHLHAGIDHMTSGVWAIFLPMWIIAPFITDGYANGIRFRHRHLPECQVDSWDNLPGVRMYGGFDTLCEERSYGPPKTTKAPTLPE